jgi:hypothetical protein
MTPIAAAIIGCLALDSKKTILRIRVFTWRGQCRDKTFFVFSAPIIIGKTMNNRNGNIIRQEHQENFPANSSQAQLLHAGEDNA